MRKSHSQKRLAGWLRLNADTEKQSDQTVNADDSITAQEWKFRENPCDAID